MVTGPAVLIATTNPGKLREIRAVLADVGVRLESLADHPPLPAAVEDAQTFEGNARIKAVHYARLTGRLVLADDSGLEVDALDGAPGVLSSRYAGPACDPAANNARLVAELAGVPSARRTARYCCAIALANEAAVLACAVGKWEGLIVLEGRGSGGFGYDPHFLLPDRDLTAAELAPEEKNRRSHRGAALRLMRANLMRLLKQAR